MRECQCSRVTQNYLCQECETHLGQLIRRTPWLIHELGTNAARQNKTSTGGNQESKTVSKNRPDIINFGALAVADELAYLVAHHGTAHHEARRPSGPKYKSDLEYLHNRAAGVIDHKPERVHLGQCPTDGCAEALNVVKGEPAHKCQGCGETIDIKAHKNERIERGYAVVCWPPEVVHFIQKMGHRLTVKDIQNWKARKRLIPAGELEGRKTYRIGDVWKLVKERDGVVDEDEVTTAV